MSGNERGMDYRGTEARGITIIAERPFDYESIVTAQAAYGKANAVSMFGAIEQDPERFILTARSMSTFLLHHSHELQGTHQEVRKAQDKMARALLSILEEFKRRWNDLSNFNKYYELVWPKGGALAGTIETADPFKHAEEWTSYLIDWQQQQEIHRSRAKLKQKKRMLKQKDKPLIEMPGVSRLDVKELIEKEVTSIEELIWSPPGLSYILPEALDIVGGVLDILGKEGLPLSAVSVFISFGRDMVKSIEDQYSWSRIMGYKMAFERFYWPIKKGKGKKQVRVNRRYVWKLIDGSQEYNDQIRYRTSISVGSLREAMQYGVIDAEKFINSLMGFIEKRTRVFLQQQYGQHYTYYEIDDAYKRLIHEKRMEIYNVFWKRLLQQIDKMKAQRR